MDDSRPGVLVVDDDPDILEAVGAVLQAGLEDVEVHSATSGAEGLEILRGRRVGLIISDFRMPGMNGAEFLRRADSFAPGVPHILMSAFPDAVVRERSLEAARVERFLPKPMDMDQLISLSRQLLSAQ